jgi:hypothetical protein
MTQLVINLSRNGFSSISGTASASYQRTRAVASTISTEIILLGSILALFQVLDGILTGIGMYYFGTTAEGNILLRVLMESYGYITALVAVKSLAIAVIAGLCFLSAQVSWLALAMKVVIAVYLFAAIIPWSYILLTKI